MKKLFLCSSFADVAKFLPMFCEEELREKTVSFIPTASLHEEYNQYVEDGWNALVSLGFVVQELEITRLTKEQIAQALENSDCIYVSGGNTFFLMQELRRKDVDKMIIQQVEKGKLYIGESAGSIIMSPDIEYAKDMDDHLEHTSDFKNFEGLGAVDFYLVPHYKSFPFEEATQNIMQKCANLRLMPIANEQVVEVVGNKARIRP